MKRKRYTDEQIAYALRPLEWTAPWSWRPRTASRGEDFRTLPTDHDPVDDALLDALLRGVQVRQEMVRSLLEDSEEAEVRGFVGSMSTENGVGALMTSIRDTLGLSLEDYRSARHASDAFSLLRQRVEVGRRHPQ